MAKRRELQPRKKSHKLEVDLMDALVHPEDGDQRRIYLKRIIYGDTQAKISNSAIFKNLIC